MDLTFLSQADSVTLRLEMAKRTLETAKSDLENAKRSYDELFAQAESHGFPRLKLKKLAEERIQALFENGIIPGEGFVSASEAKREASPKKTKKVKVKTVDEANLSDAGEAVDVGEAESSVETLDL